MTGHTADAVIIGAGIIGGAVALELGRSGRRVIVVDKGAGPGTGSTSASSAIIRFHYSYWEGVATAWEAKHWWEDWESYLAHRDPAGLASYIRTGVLMLDAPTFPMERFLAHFESIGIPFTCLTESQLAERFPFIDAGAYFPPKQITDESFWQEAARPITAVWSPEGGFVTDPQLAAQNLLRAAEQHAVNALFHRTVVGISQLHDGSHEVTLDDGTRISCGIVVNAAGPHSGHINYLAGVAGEFRVATRPLRQEVHHADAPGDYALPRGFVVMDPDLGTYFRPTPGGGLLVGGLEPECDRLMWLDNPDEFQSSPTLSQYEAQITRAARRVPKMTIPSRARGIAGVYDVSDDWIPIYDRTSLDGYYVAIGTSGNQFKAAPVVGQMMRALIDASGKGRDHDHEPTAWTAPHTGLEINMRAFSRLRRVNVETSRTVLG